MWIIGFWAHSDDAKIPLLFTIVFILQKNMPIMPNFEVAFGIVLWILFNTSNMNYISLIGIIAYVNNTFKK